MRRPAVRLLRTALGMNDMVIWTNVKVNGVVRSLPLYFHASSLDFTIAKYFACAARASLSPSALRKRGMAVALVVARCETLVGPGCGDPPGSWLVMLPRLIEQAETDRGCRELIVGAWEFLVHLVSDGCVGEAPLWRLLTQIGSRTPVGHNPASRGLLSHIVPNAPRARTDIGVAKPPQCPSVLKAGDGRPVIAFPEDRLFDFFVVGLRRCRRKARSTARSADGRLASDYKVKEVLYFLLLAFAALRQSEPLHLFVGDVAFDFECGTGALVSLWHPSKGPVLDGSARNRKAYLWEEFGLRPRHLDLGNARVGWKNLLLDEAVPGVGQRTRAYWLVPEVGLLFWHLHAVYLGHVRPMASKHPFYFASRSNLSIGTPWTLDSAKGALARVLGEIGLQPDASMGLHMHGFRHRCKHWMDLAGVSAIDQQAVLHQQSIKSQEGYGRVGPAEVAELVREATRRPTGPGPIPSVPPLPPITSRFVAIGRAIAAHFAREYNALV